jgi:hypothetical protein
MGRPTKSEGGEEPALVKFEMGVEPKLLDYLGDLVKKQGFGNSKSAIARSFIWLEVNRLIEVGRLSERP